MGCEECGLQLPHLYNEGHKVDCVLRKAQAADKLICLQALGLVAHCMRKLLQEARLLHLLPQLRFQPTAAAAVTAVTAAVAAAIAAG
jgi:hypothetical protein